MVLASSHEGALVLDPFSGSGTTLRVCQQLKRNAIGIEINPYFVTMTHERLNQPFTGFDSIDPRMERVPLDLRDQRVRQRYLENHKRWFLQRHENALRDFEKAVSSLYPETNTAVQLNLLDNKETYTVYQDASAEAR
jgi:site-specific DNA-methyltransferase (adenine-specific)